MFEKYTTKARRVIFFARYEVSELGATSIETEHLLLGLLREDSALVSRFLPADSSAEMVRKQIEGRATKGQRISTSVEVPLSSGAKEVLKYAAEETKSFGHKHIGPEHLLVGLLCRKNSLAESILRENQVALSNVRRYLRGEDEDK